MSQVLNQYLVMMNENGNLVVQYERNEYVLIDAMEILSDSLVTVEIVYQVLANKNKLTWNGLDEGRVKKLKCTLAEIYTEEDILYMSFDVVELLVCGSQLEIESLELSLTRSVSSPYKNRRRFY